MCCLLCRAGSVILSNSGCSAAGEQSPTHFQMCTDCPQSQIYSSSWRLYLMNDHSGKLRFLFVHFFFFKWHFAYLYHSFRKPSNPTNSTLNYFSDPSLFLVSFTSVFAQSHTTSHRCYSPLLPYFPQSRLYTPAKKKKKNKCMKFLTHYIL